MVGFFLALFEVEPDLEKLNLKEMVLSESKVHTTRFCLYCTMALCVGLLSGS